MQRGRSPSRHHHCPGAEQSLSSVRGWPLTLHSSDAALRQHALRHDRGRSVAHTTHGHTAPHCGWPADSARTARPDTSAARCRGGELTGATGRLTGDTERGDRPSTRSLCLSAELPWRSGDRRPSRTRRVDDTSANSVLSAPVWIRMRQDS